MLESESGVVDAKPRRGRPRSVGLAERRREELTRAAFTVFADQGYEQASVSDIAKLAGIGQGTLYRYVEGKRELLDLVFDRCVDELMTAIAPDHVIEVTATGDLDASEQMVMDLSARLFRLADERPEILKVVLVQAGSVDEEMRYRLQGLYRTFDSMMGRALAHAREREWIVTRTDHPETETVLLGRLLPALGVPGMIMAVRGDDDEDRRNAYVRAAVRLSGRGIQSDGACAESAGAPALEEFEADGAGLDPVAESDRVRAGRATELIDAAVAEFIEKGYAAVGVREITERAGVSHGTFYNYFDSKRHMLSVLVEQNTADVLGRLTAVVGVLDDPVTANGFRSAVFHANLSVLEAIAENLDEYRFLTLEVAGVDAEAYDTYLTLYRTATAKLIAVLEPARDAGLIDLAIDIEFIAEAWLSYVLGVVAAMVCDVDVTSPTESARVVTNLLLGGGRSGHR